jgi:hypothetical protein
VADEVEYVVIALAQLALQTGEGGRLQQVKLHQPGILQGRDGHLEVVPLLAHVEPGIVARPGDHDEHA